MVSNKNLLTRTNQNGSEEKNPKNINVSSKLKISTINKRNFASIIDFGTIEFLLFK